MKATKRAEYYRDQMRAERKGELTKGKSKRRRGNGRKRMIEKQRAYCPDCKIEYYGYCDGCAVYIGV